MLNVKGTYTCSKSYATFKSCRRETYTGHLSHCSLFPTAEQEFNHKHLYLLKLRAMLNKHFPLSYFKDPIYKTCLFRCLLILKPIETNRPDQLLDS